MSLELKLLHLETYNGELGELSHLGSYMSPTFDKTHPYSPSNPFIKLGYWPPVFGDSEVLEPPRDKSIKLGYTALNRDKPTASGDLPNTVFELL